MAGKRNIYGRFAGVYDQMGADHFSVQMVDYTERILRRLGVEAYCGLDLCCGTGTALRLFADTGLDMTGLDQSAAMLRQARAKLKGRKVTLVRQTLPDFRIPARKGSRQFKRFDLITCFYDSLNYLKDERELLRAFRAVYRHLAPGGLFVFDMNTPHALRIIWGSQVWGGVQDDLSWVFLNDFDEETNSARLQTTFFVKQGNYWDRFDELHEERAYSDATIRRLLRKAGLSIRGYYRCFRFEKPRARTYRICGVCTRRA